ncbi:centrosomal protein of 85 kDa-like isoform X2 [Xenopus laevis]|uniref:Centrosomal protein of 85 kDa-like isoform X2 n=1 Tax=Xenopus laevis TaxID=8355 RepID=A0A8J1KTA9_XENLA|nr:centrosomal protein of 85 kDa-like isoform X2 [Xenopus laevis]
MGIATGSLGGNVCGELQFIDSPWQPRSTSIALGCGSDFSSVWISGSDALWHSSGASHNGRISHTRRLSITSDSGDTGIGTSCSDSLEDHPTSSSSSTLKSAYPLGSLTAAHGMPSTPRSSLSRTREDRLDSSRWNSNYSLPAGSRQYGLSTDASLDMKDSRPMKKWSSLSKLSVPDGLTVDSCSEKAGSRHSLEHVGRDSTMSQHSCRHRTTCLHHSMEQLKLDDKDSDKRQYMGIDCKYKYNACNSKTLTTSAVSSRRHTLDMTYSALPESKPSTTLSEPYGQKYSHYAYQGGVPIQPSVRTQMWLTDQLHSNFQDRRLTDDTCVISNWQPLEQLRQEKAQPQVGTCSSRIECTTMPLSQDVTKWESLMKIKEGLLRQKEIVIDRQKQQICHLQQALRGNDSQANQAVVGHAVNGEDFMMHHLKENGKSEHHPSLERTKPHLKDQEDIERKLACAETEIVQLHEVLNQSTSKTSEDIKKLEDKIKTRDKYINSLRKKCQKENELNREKQRRIETLEKYLADLPTLDDVQKQSKRLQVVEEENKQLKETMKNLEKLLNESRTQCEEKDAQTDCQKQREKDLVMTVQSLQEKVQKCLEDGVRLPMLDTAQMQNENDRLREQNDRANKVIDNQQSQIENMIAEIQALREKLYQEHLAAQELEKRLEEKMHCTRQLEVLSFEQNLKEDNERMRGQIEEMQISRQPLSDKIPVAEQLFKLMSHCLFDLKALCSILNQRVHGKEPNLSLLLGIVSLNSSFEENEACQSTESLTKKLSEAHQLRKDIDDLRTMLSDCYAQDMGDNCITQ